MPERVQNSTFEPDGSDGPDAAITYTQPIQGAEGAELRHAVPVLGVKPMTRTDIHRPSAIRPEEYTWVAFKYYGGSDLGAILAMKAERERLEAHMASTGGKYSGHAHGGVCHICGCGNISYACVFYHQPTNSYIITGEDCAQKLDLGYDANGLSAFRTALRGAVEAQAGKRKAQAMLAQAGLQAAWDLYLASDPGHCACTKCGVAPTAGSDDVCCTCGGIWRWTGGFQYEEVTIRNIVGKLVKYGSISDKQQAFLRSLLGKIATRAEREAQRKAEAEAAAPCPTGRVTITGTVLTVKVQESRFGDVTKVLVKSDLGFKVWGTRPANFEKGDRVRFSADVTPNRDDPKFGFYKRPTKGEVLVSAAATAAAVREAGELHPKLAKPGEILADAVAHLVARAQAEGCVVDFSTADTDLGAAIVLLAQAASRVGLNALPPLGIRSIQVRGQ